MLPEEIWKPVPSKPGLLASSHGRIMLSPYTAPMPRGGVRVYVGEPTFGTVRMSSPGARHVYFGYSYRRFRNVKVHAAVCEAFNGPKPVGSGGVRHKNENSLDNRPENLEWASHRKNLNDPKLKRYHYDRKGRHLTSLSKSDKRSGIYDGVLDIARMRQRIYEDRHV